MILSRRDFPVCVRAREVTVWWDFANDGGGDDFDAVVKGESWVKGGRKRRKGDAEMGFTENYLEKGRKEAKWRR